jgi:predicted extracellular nuclease
LQVVAPVGGRVNESTGTVQSNGRFYAVAKGLARPFVEPGLSVFDRASRAGVSPAQFDANPERLMIESLGLRGARALSADTGDTVTGLAGILGYGAGAYRLLPEPNGNARIVSGAAPKAVSATAAGQASVGSFDLRRLLDDRRDGSEPVLAAEAYAIRLAKTANAICAYARTPDVLGVAGIEGKAALADLAAAVNANVGNELFPGACKGDAGYRGYLLAGTDSKQRNIGFLVSARVKVGSVAQIGAAATFRNRDGSSERLNERPSLVLEGSIDGVALTVVANHLAALEGDLAAPGAKGWATQGDYLRAKRAAQAAYLASWIQTRQASRPAEKLVVLGDFNASEFNDGHADLLGMVTGRPTARGRVLAYLGSPVTQPLTNLTTALPRAERYTVTRDGNAQAVDHILVNSALLSANAKAEVARINADFGEEYLDDAGVPMRVSDHDPVVLRFDLH